MRLAAALVFASASLAHAADLPCGPVEKGTIRVDGLEEDWTDVPGIDAGERDPNLSFTVKCNVDGRALYLLVDVRDNYFVRTKEARPGEDHVELTLSGRKLVIYPGDNAATQNKVTWGGKPAKGLQVASALQPKGWAVEVALPLGAIPGWRSGQPGFAYAAEVFDCDSKAQLKTERSAQTAGRIAFAEGQSALDGFLKDLHLKHSDIFFERPIALGHSSGAEAVVAGKYIAAISDGYVYYELPVSGRADIKDTRVADLAGDGRDALIVRYVERGVGGSREMVAVYRFGDSQVQRVFAAEVGKSAGSSRIEDKVSFVKRGRATDIVVEAGSAVGWSSSNYKEAPAEDAVPILLPWADDRRARYQFHGDEYQRAQ
jgi:hypothetical protein